MEGKKREPGTSPCLSHKWQRCLQSLYMYMYQTVTHSELRSLVKKVFIKKIKLGKKTNTFCRDYQLHCVIASQLTICTALWLVQQVQIRLGLYTSACPG
jgi:hypothetical protein